MNRISNDDMDMFVRLARNGAVVPGACLVQEYDDGREMVRIADELATERDQLRAEVEWLRADADKFALHVTSERWLEIMNERTSLLAEVQQLRAQLAAVPDYAADVAANSSVAAVPFEQWYKVWRERQP